MELNQVWQTIAIGIRFRQRIGSEQAVPIRHLPLTIRRQLTRNPNVIKVEVRAAAGGIRDANRKLLIGRHGNRTRDDTGNDGEFVRCSSASQRVQRGHIARHSGTKWTAVRENFQPVAAAEIAVPQADRRLQGVNGAGLKLRPQGLKKCISGGRRAGHRVHHRDVTTVHVGQDAAVN